MWELWNDRTGRVVETGTEEEMKAKYFSEIDRGVPEMDLFVEGPDGSQYAWNSNRKPPGWEEI